VPAPETKTRASSPAATGGAGTFFEQHVNAHWLALLLVRGIPPILHDSAVVEVHLQTEHLGWSTDDFLVVAESGPSRQRKLAGQVKRNFTVSAADDECKKTIVDFWKDYTCNASFSAATDRFALVVLRGTNTLLEHLGGLLDLARSVPDGAEFERRLGVPGIVHSKAVDYCDAIRTIIGEYEGRTISVSEAWPLLRLLHVLSLDLNTQTRQTESMVKSLLAYTSQEPDSAGAAETTWAALLQAVGEGMPLARSFTREALPEATQLRHSPVAGGDRRPLRALADHSALILAGIRSTIGPDFHLPRGRLVQQVLVELESAQVVLVSGAAGSGKSAVAKDAVSVLASDHFAFCFRAEELACAHFDETLQRSQIPANAAQVGAILAGQGRKVLLVESVERLLEAATRDALTDLLTLVRKDNSWRLILTCRDYSSDLVRSSFLRDTVGHAVVSVPPLDDDEVGEVAAVCPALARPLQSPHLRGLLRNPYVLDKALQITWSDERPLPQSEREFRDRFWRDVIRRDDRAGAGMPRRRETAFGQVALRRARALALYASCGDLDAEALEVLRHDSLVVTSPEQTVLAAPAHDVLEDWAILRWIDEQHAVLERSAPKLANVLGPYPALRRVFRKWVGELVKREPEAADALFQSAVSEAALPAQFRDDLLVALLQCPDSVAFLGRHSPQLLDDGKRLLYRVIHLLRVACVKTPDWLPQGTSGASLFRMPDGPAWPCVLGLVQDQLRAFSANETHLLLGFIEDWARGVSWQTPYLDGAEAATAIAYSLLPHFDEYREREQRQRALRVLAKIPNADPKAFSAILRGGGDSKWSKHLTEELREIVLEGMEGMPACRDLPDEVIEAAREELLSDEKDLPDPFGYSSPVEIEALFGIRDSAHSGYFPASAFRGPFLQLLRHHHRKGLAFILAMLNHSTDRYAHPRAQEKIVEPPFEITLTFTDGAARTQWANDRLWGLYRGVSVGPYVLQCALMALERWLLDIAEAQPTSLDRLLLHVLRQCNSAAITAVVASVATAWPSLCGEALLVLLSCPECVRLDRRRLSRESGAGMSGFMTRMNARDDVYHEERKQADERPHRRQDLEFAIASLQLGPLASRVHQILDGYLAAMPSTEAQDEDDRVWRLALHRMDLRQYRIANEQPAPAPDAGGDSAEKRQVLLTLKEPAPDLQEMVRATASQFEAMSARIRLLMWGQKSFERDQRPGHNPAQWREHLALARGGGMEPVEVAYSPGRGGMGFVAAVCARDHWDEMSAEDQRWCVSTICAAVERDADNWNELARIQRGAMDADRPCAWVLPTLLSKGLESADRGRVLHTLALALTHAINEVRAYAAAGVGDALWVSDRKLALHCANMLATEAALVQQAFDRESEKPYPDRRHLDAIEAEVASVIRPRFLKVGAFSGGTGVAFDPAEWIGSEANVRILTILAGAPDEPATTEAYVRLAGTLVAWWDADVDRETRERRNYETEAALRELLVAYLLRAPGAHAASVVQPILAAVERHPSKIHWLLQGLIAKEDQRPNTSQFWMLWRLFAQKLRTAPWLKYIDDEYFRGDEMLSTMFLGTWWKDEVRHWRSLEGHADNIHELFDSLPPSAAVLADYVRFLYRVGERSLPEAFIRVTARLRTGDSSRMLAESNTVFLLERLLERYVYGRPLELKRNRQLQAAVLELLDMLVDRGSSAAFSMRDDFVTPLPVI
jgi:hypothetical protein